MSDVQIALSVGLAAMRVTKKHSVLLFMRRVKAKWRLLCGTPAIKMIHKLFQLRVMQIPNQRRKHRLSTIEFSAENI